MPVYEPMMQQQQPHFISTSMAPLSSAPVVVHAVPPGMGPPMGSSFMQSIPMQQDYPYGYGYQQQQQQQLQQPRPEGPLKRFLRGAADGFMLGTMGWLG